jgi:exopolyphosphatase
MPLYQIDLDSIASAVGLAYFANNAASKDSSEPYRYIPLYQAESSDLALRPENAYALDASSIDPVKHILWLDDLPSPHTTLADSGVKFALVDHNHLSPTFGHLETDASVIALIDHHADEGHHKAAEPRRIQVPTGSCSSLVAEWGKAQGFQAVPKPLADILISAALIDTGNYKPAPKGKAVESDMNAREYLLPLSSFAKPSSAGVAAASTESSSDPLDDHTDLLQAKKYDLSRLQGRDLLRRDYKEYESETLHIRYGLSTVPLRLDEWLHRSEVGGNYDQILNKMEDWGKERDLDIVGVLTSYVDPKKGREHLHLVRQRQDNQLDRLKKVIEELTKDETLDLGQLKKAQPPIEGTKWQGRVFAYQQKNAGATRKQVAPAFKKAIETVERLAGRL